MVSEECVRARLHVALVDLLEIIDCKNVVYGHHGSGQIERFARMCLDTLYPIHVYAVRVLRLCFYFYFGAPSLTLFTCLLCVFACAIRMQM